MTTIGVLMVLFATSTADIHRLHGNLDDGYAVDIDIGTPSQRLSLIVDTGSANLAVASYNNINISCFYDPDKSSTCDKSNIQHSFKVSYTVGSWLGRPVRDDAKLAGGNMGATKVNVALIYDSQSFFVNNSGWQGILGLGYKALAQPSNFTEPFFDTLSRLHFMKGNPNNSFALQLCGPKKDFTMEGNLSISEVDSTQYRGNLYNVAVTSSDYYQVIMTDMKVDNQSLDLECTEYNNPRTIVDSGTTNLLLPATVYHMTLKSIRAIVKKEVALKLNEDFWYFGGSVCTNYSLLEIFPVLTIELMAEDYENVISLNIPSTLYIRPLKMQPNCYKLGVKQSSSGTILGTVVMEGFYIVFNRYKQAILQFGISSCPLRDWSTSITNYHLTALPPLDCRHQPNTPKSGFPPYALALLVIFIVLIAFILTYAISRVVKSWHRRHHRLITNVDFQDLMHDTFDDPNL